LRGDFLVLSDKPGVLLPDDVDFAPIILDVNALMAPFQFGLNLDAQLSEVVPDLTPVVPTSAVRELEMLLGKGNDWKIKAAIELSRKYHNIDIKGKGDAPIFNLAVNKGWTVLTSDGRLRRKLLDRGIPVVFVRDRGYFEIKYP
jgi:rRNA-processing protein FCF1